MPFLKIYATASKKVAPDYTTVTITHNVTAKTQEETLKKANAEKKELEKTIAVKTLLRIILLNERIAPNNQYIDNKYVINGYISTITYSVDFPFNYEKFEELNSTLAQLNLNIAVSPSHYIKHSEKISDELTIEAYNIAFKKAELFKSHLFNKNTISVENIDYSVNQTHAPMLMRSSFEASTTEVKDITLSESITVTFKCL